MTISRLNGSYILPERFRMPGRRICLPLRPCNHSSFLLSSSPSFADFFLLLLFPPFLSFRYFSLRGARINRPRKCRRSARYTAPAWSVFFVCTREFEERGSSEIRSKTRARKRGSFFEGTNSRVKLISSRSPTTPRFHRSMEKKKKKKKMIRRFYYGKLIRIHSEGRERVATERHETNRNG